MRVAAGSVNDFANVTWPANANATLSLSLFFGVASFGGIPANLLVIYVSFRSSLVTGNYKYFLANLAICDLAACFANMFQFFYHLYHLLCEVPLDITKCHVQTAFPYTFGFCMVAALPLASINRYCVICRDLEAWFTKRKILLLCLTAYFPLLYPIIDFLFAPQAVYYTNLCTYTLFTPFNPEWIFFVLGIYVYPSLIFSNMGVYKKLSTHMSKTKKLLGTQTDINRSILKGLVIQASIPPICCLPILIVILTVAFSGVGLNPDALSAKVVVRFSETAVLTTMDLGFIFFNLNPMLDALVTLTVVNPYRIATKELFLKIMKKFGYESTTVDVVEVNPKSETANGPN
uniref:G-protein coupled receptors family 1 profile domain-containing protein n=1 Tax=Plectus sambesii TaxID=2011161 RepID=A0A914XTE4_9BILA